eukprot:s11279_g1.t1
MSVTSIMKTLARYEQWQQAMCVFSELSQRSVQRNVVVFSTAVVACSKGRRWDQA